VEEKEKQKSSNSLSAIVKNWWKTSSYKMKIFCISFLILMLSFYFINKNSNKNLLKKLEKSKNKTEEKLRSILVNEIKIDGYTSEVIKIEDKINNIEMKIEEIQNQKPEESSLDKFFDKRV